MTPDWLRLLLSRRMLICGFTGFSSRLPLYLLLNLLPAWPYGDSKVYLCGPLAFMRAQWQQLIEAGVPVLKLHREVFGPEMLDHLL